MDNWKKVRLSNVLEQAITGEWGMGCIEGEAGIKVLRTTNFTKSGVINYDHVVLRSIPAERVEKKKLKPYDIILEKSGGSDHQPVGRVVFFENSADDVFLCNNFTQILRVKQSIAFPKYIFFYLYHLYQNGTTKSLQNKTTGIRNLQVKRYLELKIPLPSVPVQQQISDVMDRCVLLIEQRKSQIEKLQLLIDSQFQALFGDPVTNSKGWEILPLQTLCDVRDGTHDSPTYVPNGYPLLTSKNFTNGYVDLQNVNYITKSDFDAINKRSKVEYGDIVMPMIGTIGCPVIVDTNEPFAIKNVALIKFCDKGIHNVYLQSLLSSYFLEHVVRQSNRGGTQKFIALGDIRKLPIPLPPITLQNQFAKFVEQVSLQKSQLQQSLKKLERTYKSLMQKCFRGEIF